jgi:hypothetical protein
MTKARNLSDLLDNNGDVKIGSLDNVPPSDNASSLTTGTLAIDRLDNGSITNAKLNNDAKVVKSASAPSSPVEGDLWYDTANETLKIYSNTDSAFVKVVRVIPTLDSISGNIVNTIATNLTLTGTGFLASNLIVSFTPSGGSVSTVTVTPTNDTTATVAIPSAIYNQSASTVISISVQNSDIKNSNTSTKTVVELPSGGTITNSGGYIIHTFTSSGTFTNTLSLTNVEYLVLAGGGGGGSRHGGGGGGGGYRSSVVGENSGKSSSAETRQSISAGSYTVTVGAGGAGGYGDGSANAVGQRGGNSVFNGITSIGGGGGMNDGDPETQRDGGCGGGADYRANSHGTGTAGQGYDGGDGSGGSPYHGGGGGGTGQVGGNASGGTAGAGGNGTASSINGSNTVRGGGGGGGAYEGTGGSGGSGGGGAGSAGTSGATNGSTNYGAGGGGLGEATSNSHVAGAGGSGIVIVRYQL